MLRRTMWVTVAALLIAGCSTIPKPPSCDGYSRRPLNKSMWEQAAGLEDPAAQISEAAPDQGDGPDQAPSPAMVYTTAFHADPYASLRACG